MRNFSRDSIAVRKTDNLTVVFYSPRVIYIKSTEGIYLCDGWFAQKGFYGESFKPFGQALREFKQIDMSLVRSLARKYDIHIKQALHLPKISGRVEFLPSDGRKRKTKTGDDDVILGKLIFGDRYDKEKR